MNHKNRAQKKGKQIDLCAIVSQPKKVVFVVVVVDVVFVCVVVLIVVVVVIVGPNLNLDNIWSVIAEIYFVVVVFVDVVVVVGCYCCCY